MNVETREYEAQPCVCILHHRADRELTAHEVGVAVRWFARQMRRRRAVLNRPSVHVAEYGIEWPRRLGGLRQRTLGAIRLTLEGMAFRNAHADDVETLRTTQLSSPRFRVAVARASLS